MGASAKNVTPLIVPASIRRKAGFKPGEPLEFRAHGGVITIRPKVEPADDETPEQRRKILRGVRKGLKEIQQGKYTLYSSVAEMAADIEAAARKRSAARRKK